MNANHLYGYNCGARGLCCVNHFDEFVWMVLCYTTISWMTRKRVRKAIEYVWLSTSTNSCQMLCLCGSFWQMMNRFKIFETKSCEHNFPSEILPNRRLGHFNHSILFETSNGKPITFSISHLGDRCYVKQKTCALWIIRNGKTFAAH